MAHVLLLFVLAGVVLDALPQTPPPRIRTVPPPTREGWWLRVDAQATKAAAIQWLLGTNPKQFTVKTTWSAGGGAEFDLPESVRKENVIHMQAMTAPAGAPVVVCVFHQQQGVARVEFNGTDDRQLNQKMKEPKCTP